MLARATTAAAGFWGGEEDGCAGALLAAVMAEGLNAAQLLDGKSWELIPFGRRSDASPFWVPGEVVGGAGSALRSTGTVRGTGLVRNEPESLSSCLLLKPRTNCNLRNF